MKQQCPCGCDLQLSANAREQWLTTLTGMRAEALPTSLRVEREMRKEPPEPMASGICRACGPRMQIAEYLAVFLERNKAAWPECDGCAALWRH